MSGFSGFPALVTQGDVVPVGDARLRALASEANAEHGAVLASLSDAVVHAIRAGEALLAARELVPPGTWQEWATENFAGGLSTGNQYMRVARYKAHVLDAPQPIPLRQAYLLVRGLPPVNGTVPVGRHSRTRTDAAEAKRLCDSGMPQAEVAELFGVSQQTISYWLNPKTARDRAKRRARMRDARLALQQKERERAAKKAGGGIAEAYSLMRKTAQALDRAKAEAGSQQARAAILNSLASVHRAEDELVQALGIEHGSNARTRTARASTAEEHRQ